MSRRVTTRRRVGLEKKKNALARKARKLAKKDPTWKSRHPKDPGIPNSFPYKIELLEELKQKRMQEIELRQSQREEMRQRALIQGANEDDLANMEVQQDIVDNQNRLGALMESVQAASMEYGREHGQDQDVDENMDSEDSSDEVTTPLTETFGHIKPDVSRKTFEKAFQEVVSTCDVLIYVLDARNPNGTRSKVIEESILANPNKRLLFALNKIDLVPYDVVKSWVRYLRGYFPTVPFSASSAAPNAITFKHDKWTRFNTAGKLLESLKRYSTQTSIKHSTTVGVIGYPNVGKSSVINALLQRHSRSKTACPIGAEAGVTRVVRKVKVDKMLMIVDCPGIVFPSASQKKLDPINEHARLILLNAVTPKTIGDCRHAAALLLKRIIKSPEQTEMLMKRYDLPPVPSENFNTYVTGILVHIARHLGRLNRQGVPNLGAAAKALVTDWRDGRISGWSEPPKVQESNRDLKVVESWSKEFDLDGILDQLLASD